MRLFQFFIASAILILTEALSHDSANLEDSLTLENRGLQQVLLPPVAVLWLLEVTLDTSGNLNPNATVCMSQGKVVPFFELVEKTAVNTAKNFLKLRAEKFGLPSSQMVWTLDKFKEEDTSVIDEDEDEDDRRRMRENDQGSRALQLPGFRWYIGGSCRPGFCNPDNGDGRRRRLQTIEKLSNKVERAVKRVMTKRCGILGIIGVTFQLV